MSELIDSAFEIQQLLEHHAVPSALIGGLALPVWGRPRLTHDVDLKLLLRRDNAELLVEILKPDYKPVQPDPLQALRQNGVLFIKNRLISVSIYNLATQILIAQWLNVLLKLNLSHIAC